MQIREIKLTELHLGYELIKLETNIDYKEYEDLIYQMIKENYKIITIIEKEKAVVYAGVKIETNLSYKKHLHIYELITFKDKRYIYYTNEMLSYLIDYARINQCKNIILSVNKKNSEIDDLLIKNSFIQEEIIKIKEL